MISERFSFDQRQIDFILTILIDNIRLRSIRDKPSRSLNQHSKRKQAEQPKPRVCPFNEYVNNENQGFQARSSRRKDVTEETGEHSLDSQWLAPCSMIVPAPRLPHPKPSLFPVSSSTKQASCMRQWFSLEGSPLIQTYFVSNVRAETEI